jgi:hypothetical protein
MSKNLILLLIALILPTAAAIAAWFVVPQFATMFSEFGAELPWSTRLLLASYRGWLGFPLLVLVIGLTWPAPKDRMVAAVSSGAILAALMFAFMIWACYSPIFGLAAQADT